MSLSAGLPQGVKAVLFGVIVYALTACLVFGGTLVGRKCLRPDGLKLGEGQSGTGVADMLCQWDGQFYCTIARDGYAYDRGRASSVAFFPLYSTVGRAVGALTGMSTQFSLLAASQVCLILAMVLLLEYGRVRMAGGVGCSSWPSVVFLALFPVGLFMRLAYTESLFLFLSLLAFYGMERRWCAVGIAVVIGLATAARPPGIVLVLPLAIHVWRRRRNVWRGLVSFSYLGPIACGGLLSYMLYLWCAFGDPFAFAQTQEHFRVTPRVSVWEHTLILVSGEPLWSPYSHSSMAYWRRFDTNTSAWLSLQFANPIYFVLGACLLGLGTLRGWLTELEISFGTALLLMGYVTRGYEMCMASQGRFVSVVFPMYIVMERLVEQWPVSRQVGAFSLFAAYLFTYSVMWGAGRVLI